jgi:hypothetical protein
MMGNHCYIVTTRLSIRQTLTVLSTKPPEFSVEKFSLGATKPLTWIMKDLFYTADLVIASMINNKTLDTIE